MTTNLVRLSFAAAIGLSACSSSSTPPADTKTGPAAPAPPKGSPTPFTVLLDDDSQTTNTADYHILIAADVKHDAVQKLLEFLYRYLMTRRDPGPAALTASVYSNEAQFKTPPRSPIATVTRKSGELGPTFENKVPLEFWQQIDQALSHSDKGWKLEKKTTRDDAGRTLVITQPYTDMGKDAYAPTLSFNQAMNIFTDTAKALFDGVPELRQMTFVGQWNGEDVVKITLDRATYQSLQIGDIDERIGQQHGRTFLEAAQEKSSNEKLAKAQAGRIAGIYKKMLAGLKGNAVVSPKLK